MSDTPTVLVLGRRTTNNMPSLARMLEILKPREEETPGMDATVPTSSVRITSTHVATPVMGRCWICGASISSGTVCDACNKGPEAA